MLYTLSTPKASLIGSDTITGTPFAHGLKVNLACLLLLALTACGGDGSTSPAPPAPPAPPQPTPQPATPVATRIAITPASATLTAIGQTVQLTAQVFDQNDNVMTGAAVTWSSGNTGVASVSTAGLITAIKSGTTRITARSGNAAQHAEVTVVQTPASIVIDPNNATLTAFGETVQLSARVLDPDRFAIEGAGVTWQSSDETVATVNAAGLVTAVSNGVAGITAAVGDISAKVDVTVKQTPASIVIDPEEATLAAAGDTVQLNAAVLDRNGHAIEGAEVTWESGDEAIATVDGQGLVTASGSGTVEITARSGEVSSVSTVTVKGEVTDREALTALYQETNGDGWTSNDNWLSDAPLSDWYGVTATTAGEVSRLDLRRNNLQGPLPAELCHLAALVVMDLQYNDLTGNIPPEFGLLANLTWLGLSGNGLTGGIPPEIGQLTELSTLALDSTELTGPIPPELGQLTDLTWLSILNSQLSGNIPPELGQLENLTVLTLPGNELTGSIPPELGQLTSLERLSLTGNNLTGTIPPELGQLVDLTHLELSSNRLTGEIPLELGQLTALTHLSLTKNRLTGIIPPELAQLTELTKLGLDYNELTGNIPTELAQLTRLELLYFDRNELTGNIPAELGQLTNLRELWFNDNRLSGSIPSELGQLANLQSLNLQDNRLSGAIPPELGQLIELRFLSFADNPGLSGPLPDSFTALEKMTTLALFNTDLCVPPAPDFRAWIDRIQSTTGVQYCSSP